MFGVALQHTAQWSCVNCLAVMLLAVAAIIIGAATVVIIGLNDTREWATWVHIVACWLSTWVAWLVKLAVSVLWSMMVRLTCGLKPCG